MVIPENLRTNNLPGISWKFRVGFLKRIFKNGYFAKKGVFSAATIFPSELFDFSMSINVKEPYLAIDTNWFVSYYIEETCSNYEQLVFSARNILYRTANRIQNISHTFTIRSCR